MRFLGWIFIALYAALIAGFIYFDASVFEGLPIVSAVTFVSLAIFLFGAGSKSICRPVRRPRLWLPVASAAFMLTALVAGATLALAELFRVPLHVEDDAIWLLLALAGNWIGWAVVLYVYTRELKRFEVIHRLGRFIFAGSLAELLASIPSHIFVMRRGGCFAGISTSMGMIAGMCVMLWSFGPAIMLLEAYQRENRERRRGNTELSGRNKYVQFGLHTLLGICAGCGVTFGLIRIFWGHWVLVALLSIAIVILLSLVLLKDRRLLGGAALLVFGGLSYVFWNQGTLVGIVYVAGMTVLIFALLRADKQAENSDVGRDER